MKRSTAQDAARLQRIADVQDVLVPLNASRERPLHRQVYDGLREEILAGRLRPGERLPSTRALASDLAVARNTVVLAYDQLRAEGYIVGRRGGGTRVRRVVPDTMLGVRRRSERANAAPLQTPVRSTARATMEAASVCEPQLSERGHAIARAGAMLLPGRVEQPVPFQLGVPAVDTFPARIWARLAARRWRRGEVFLGEGDPAGDPELRAAVAAYVTRSRAARCTADQVIIVSGAQQALDLAARVLLDVGDAAWIEDPGYVGAAAALTAAGARVVPVPVDEQGLDVHAGERAAPHARLVCVTPSHQFPLGAVMSAPRRLALLAWAQRTRAWVIEDDYDAEFRYTGRPLPCLQGLEAERLLPPDTARVLYVGTFSKSLAPGLRIAYLILPEALVSPFRAARAAIDRFPSASAQAVLADFISGSHYARHLRRVRALYAERQVALLSAAEELRGLLTVTPDAAGLHLVGWLPTGVSDVAAAAATSAEGVTVSPLSRFRLGASGSVSGTPSAGALLLGYAAFEGSEIRTGVRKLRRALLALRG